MVVRMTERIYAVPVLLRYAHAFAELLYASIHIRTERIRRRKPFVEIEQVGVVSLGKIFLN